MYNRFTTQTYVDIKKEPLHVVICAGGLEYRKKSLGPNILQIHEGESILEIQTKTILHTFPDAKITVTAGFQADKVIRHRPQIGVVENQLWETTNTAEELRLYLNTVHPYRLLIIDGPIYFNHHALKIVDNSSVLEFEGRDDKDIGIKSDNGFVEHFSFSFPNKWAGLVYLEDKPLEMFKRTVKRENNKLCIFELLNIIVQEKIELKSVINNHAEIIKL